MKMYDYSELIRVINNVEMREEKERIMGILELEEKYKALEHSLVISGIFEDWNRLKQLCSKAKVRLCVSCIGESSIGRVLGLEDYGYCNEYKDSGEISQCMDSGSYYSDYYGFTYDNSKGLVWKIYHTTPSHRFDGFKEGQDEKKYKTKIYLLETFRDTYEIYREFQLKKVEERFTTRIKTEDIIN